MAHHRQHSRDDQRGTRWALIAVALLLTSIGVLFVHSTRAGPDEVFPSKAALGHAVRAAVGLGALFVMTRVDYRRFARWAPAIYVCVLLLLVLALAIKYAAGTRGRWIALPFFQLQPSELMKLALILGLATYLQFRSDQRRLGGLVRPYLLTFVPMALVLISDLGTSLMFPPVLLAMLFVAGARPRHLALTVAVGVISLPAAYLVGDHVPVIQSYQRDRLVAYVRQNDPDVRRQEAYQLAQSEIALGNGGLLGRGLRSGTQNSLDFLPARHNDFIFSIIGEEWGFVGTSSVALLMLALVLLCLRVALRTREPFGRLVTVGVGVAFAAQSFQNMGMTMGLTPITGLTLPFISHGGSSLVSCFLSLGLVISVAARRVPVVATSDLAPLDPPRCVPVVDDRPAGSLLARWPT